MKSLADRALTEVIATNKDSILDEWISEMAVATRRSDLMKDPEVRSQCSEFLKALQFGTESGNYDLESSAWRGARKLLGNISRSRAQQGFTPSETATFVFSVKKPLFSALRNR